MLDGDGDVLMLDFEPEMVEDAHVDVGDPDECEPRDEVAAPTFVEKLEAEEHECEGRDVVREAVLAGEQVEEFAFGERTAGFAFLLAELAGLAEDFFVRDRPGSAGDRECEQKQDSELVQERDREQGWHQGVGCT